MHAGRNNRNITLNLCLWFSGFWMLRRTFYPYFRFIYSCPAMRKAQATHTKKISLIYNSRGRGTEMI